MCWYDGVGVDNVLFYVWEVGPDCPPSGLSTDIVDSTCVDLLGEVIAGPIPYAPVPGFDWQGIELSEYTGDINFELVGDSVEFIMGFIKLGEALQPLAADTREYLGVEENHTFVRGPGLSDGGGFWKPYNTYIELCMRAGVTYYTEFFPPFCFTQLPSTYDGNQDFIVDANITDNEPIPEGNVQLKYVIDNGTDTITVTMTALGNDLFQGLLSEMGLVVGNNVKYWIKVEDADNNVTISSSKNFYVIEPQNPNANILLANNGMAIDAAGPIQAFLEENAQEVEVYNISDNNGWDESITTYTGNNGTVYDAIIIMGFGTSTVPTRDYAGNPVAAYLDAGGNLLYADQDYFYTNGEVEFPEFTEGEFASDYFGISGGVNDPGQDAILAGYGIGFLENIHMELNYSVFGSYNWPDCLFAGDAVPIMLSEDLGGTWTDSTLGVYYQGDGFQTILIAAPILAMNEGTAENVILSDDFKALLWHCLHDGFGMELPNSVENSEDEYIHNFQLKQNYPNPFNPETTIEYHLQKASAVELVIFNSLGQKVITLVNQQQTRGEHSVQWDGRDDSGLQMSSGVYYYRLKAGSFTQMHKMVLMK